MVLLLFYIALFIFAFIAYRAFSHLLPGDRDQTKTRTVTFGDESAIKSNRIASVLSIISLLLIWAAFTGSKLSPVHVPGPFIGDTSFNYTAVNNDNQTDMATVYIRVLPVGSKGNKPALSPQQDGFAQDDSVVMQAWRSKLIRPHRNDVGSKHEDYRITHINAYEISPEQTVPVEEGTVAMTRKGSLSFTPNKGWQMEPIWLPSPEAVFNRLLEIANNGYQNITLLQHVGWSLLRVLAGFLLGCLVGIPLGYAMGLNGWFRGWFDPIVEFMRPVPPLALIPLVIIWFGIWETGKISLLFLAALWIMIIAARAGVSNVNIDKVHAAYSLGASKRQLMLHVIIPNSLPELFTGARVAMGVCWGTVVAAELVAAEKGAGKMIIAASKFQQTDIVIMGIILIGIIGYTIDILMRKAQNILVPWKGKI